MYSQTITMMSAYIKNFLDIDVFDATKTFIDPDSYASIFVLSQDPASQHSNLVDEFNDTQLNEKKFIFNDTQYISVRVDFRGVNAVDNMALFKSSFLKEAQRDIIRNAGFGFMGIGAVTPISTLRDVKAKAGLTTTVKFIITQQVEDSGQIVETTGLTVTNTLP